MRDRSPAQQKPTIIQHLAKDFARFVNRVQNQQVDFLGSFLIENEWEKYVDDGNDVLQSLELAGFVVCPREPSDDMIVASDPKLQGSLMGQRGVRIYISAVFGAMVQKWVDTRSDNLILDIMSMALSRASNPTAKRESSLHDSSFQRFRRSSVEMLKGLEQTGYMVLPDEPTPAMVAAGVAETAEHKSSTKGISIGADPAYLAALYEHMVAARPVECRSRPKKA